MRKVVLTICLGVGLSLTAFASNERPCKQHLEVTESHESAFDFDINAYLPATFNPYKGMIIDESYLLIDEPIAFQFDIESYLPEYFNVYNEMISDETYLASAKEIELSFDIAAYLPTYYDVYSGWISDESSYLIDSTIDFDFDMTAYLPTDFDVYNGMFVVEQLEEEAIPFAFNIEDFLPAGFNPNSADGSLTM